eukprot:365493-Chlamydomonas_euryale.AAC.3
MPHRVESLLLASICGGRADAQACSYDRARRGKEGRPLGSDSSAIDNPRPRCLEAMEARSALQG